MDTRNPSRTLPTELPPPPPSGVVLTGLKNAEYNPNASALDALENVRFSLTQKMNVCKSPVEAKMLGETYRHIVSAIELIASFEAP